MKNKKLIAGLVGLSLFLMLGFLFLGLTSKNMAYVLSRRWPKVLAIIITGVAIALSSAIFQTITDNRILTPSVLGLDSLYLLIQTGVIFILGSGHRLILDRNLNFILTVGLMLVFSGLVYRRLLKKARGNLMYLLLVGIIMGSLFQSLSSFMQMMIDPNEFLHIQDSMFASFNNINIDILLISSLLIGLISIYIGRKSRELDLLALGRDRAINLGLDYDEEIRKLLFLVSILVSLSTALVGPISFLGLLIVNLAREIMEGYEHRELLIISSLLGIVALLGGQLMVERVLNFSTPISVIINFVGGIYFIYLLLKENIE